MKHAPLWQYVAAIVIGVPGALILVFLAISAERMGVRHADNWIIFMAETVCLLLMLVTERRWALRRRSFLLMLVGVLVLQTAVFGVVLKAFSFEWRAPWWGVVFMGEYIALSSALTWMGYPVGGRVDPRRLRPKR